MAFQIADDVLDLVGDQDTVGKSLGTDLLKQKATLPVIRLLGAVASPERGEVIGLLARSDNHRREALEPWFARYDAIRYAREKAEWCTRRASRELASLPASDAAKS